MHLILLHDVGIALPLGSMQREREREREREGEGEMLSIFW
jgi:hypothetical protein